MSNDSDVADIAQVADIGYYLLGILYLVGNSHVLEFSLTLAMSVEVEADAGNAVCLKGIADELKERPVLSATKTMTEDHHRTLLTCLQFWLHQDGLQFSVMSVNADALTAFGRGIASCRFFLQVFINLISQYRRECHLAVRTDDNHRGNPLHSVCFGNVCLLEFLEFADLRVLNTILTDGFLPRLHIGIHRNTQELNALLVVGLIHSDYLRCVFPAVRTPRCPKVEYYSLTLGPF